MFLKSYTGLSDDGLIEMLNGSIHMQMFCGVLIVLFFGIHMANAAILAARQLAIEERVRQGQKRRA